MITIISPLLTLFVKLIRSVLTMRSAGHCVGLIPALELIGVERWTIEGESGIPSSQRLHIVEVRALGCVASRSAVPLPVPLRWLFDASFWSDNGSVMLFRGDSGA